MKVFSSAYHASCYKRVAHGSEVTDAVQVDVTLSDTRCIYYERGGRLHGTTERLGYHLVSYNCMEFAELGRWSSCSVRYHREGCDYETMDCCGGGTVRVSAHVSLIGSSAGRALRTFVNSCPVPSRLFTIKYA